jgi:hypothetical protein
VHTTVLTRSQLTVLDGLTTLAPVGEFYLAGGTALALRHGHRRSVDFDFFRQEPFDTEALTVSLHGVFDDIQRLPTGAETLYVRVRGVTTSFFRYPYPMLEPIEPTIWGFGLASDADIGAMKVEAVAGRGSRKDFVDLRLLCRSGLSLERLFDFFDRKFGTARTERYHRLRALTYFEDAEQEPMPDLLVPFDWEEAKRFFTAEATRLLGAQAP